MKTVEEIALAVCEKIGPVAMCKDPLAFSEMVVAAVDAERGKDATAWMLDTPNGVIRLEGFIGESQKCNDLWKPLFLSPTIPEGMALVLIDIQGPTDEQIDEISESARKSFRRHQASCRGQQVTQSDDPDFHIILATWGVLKAMIQAAGVTK